MTHTLKIWPGNYDAVSSGDKTHEIRNCSDRTFTKGDIVLFKDWMPKVDEKGFTGQGEYTARSPLLRKITYVSKPGSWGLPPNICVFSFK